MLSRRALLAAALALLGVGCTGKTDFTISKTLAMHSTGGVPYSYVVNADLSQEAGSAWSHRDKIKSLDIVGLDLTMTARTDTNGPTTGTGTIVLSRNGSSATVGSWTAAPIGAAPESIAVTLNKDAVSIIEDAIHGDGQFTVTAAGTTGVDVIATVQIDLHLHMTFKVP